MLKEPYAPRFLGHLFDLVKMAMHSAYHRIKLVKRRISICIILPLTKPVLTAVKTTTKITVAAANNNHSTEKSLFKGSFFYLLIFKSAIVLYFVSFIVTPISNSSISEIAVISNSSMLSSSISTINKAHIPSFIVLEYA